MARSSRASELGAGGMGVVVAAVHIHLNERVALKMLLPEGGDPEFGFRCCGP